MVQLTQKVSIIDESYSMQMIDQPVVLALIARDRFCYVILDRERMKLSVLKDFRTVQHAFEDESQLFSKVLELDQALLNHVNHPFILAMYDRPGIMVPSPLFDRRAATSIYSLSMSLTSDEKQYDDFIRESNAFYLYTASEKLAAQVSDFFHDAKIVNAGSAFIDNRLRSMKISSGHHVSVNIHSHTLEILAANKGELLLYNTYPCESSEDCIYYLLFVFEQLQMNPDQVPVTFFGEIDENSAAWVLARKYIRHVEMGSLPDELQFSYVFNQVAPQQYYALYSQYLCVS